MRASSIFCKYKKKGGLWFRVFGFGLSIENRTIIPPSFSERNEYSKCCRIGKYAIQFLGRQ